MTPELELKLAEIQASQERTERIVRSLAGLVAASNAVILRQAQSLETIQLSHELLIDSLPSIAKVAGNEDLLSREKAIDDAVEACLARKGILQN